VDFFDPNTWSLEDTHEYRIYLDDRAQTWALVDAEDYWYFSQWKWHANKPHKRRFGKKVYARRSLSNGARYKAPEYLHVAIHKRTGSIPPSLFHTLVDHENGNELDCRRKNLRWATVQENNKNRRSSVPLLEGVCLGHGSEIAST